MFDLRRPDLILSTSDGTFMHNQEEINQACSTSLSVPVRLKFAREGCMEFAQGKLPQFIGSQATSTIILMYSACNALLTDCSRRKWRMARSVR